MRRTFVTDRLRLFASVFALLAAAPAMASAQAGQRQPSPAAPDDRPRDDADTSATAADVAGPLQTGTGEQDIVVTGSRISRPELAFPNPVQSFTSAAIEQSGDINITDFLADSPALIGSITSTLTSGSNFIGLAPAAGLNLLNLRNLGFERTLVLVNGRRHVAAYPGTSSVDVNSIPNDLIERIDVLTGGFSAIYGADGVSGVVNFVLKRNFEGVRARGQVGISEEGDAGTRFGSIAAGRNFADGRGNIAAAYEYTNSSRLNDSDRPFTGDPARRFELLQDPTERGAEDDPNVPDRRLFNFVGWADSAPNGAVDLDLDFFPDFEGDGDPYDAGTFLPGTGGRAVNGSSNTPTAGYFGDFLPYLERHNLNLLASYAFSPTIRLFAEGKYVDTTAFTVSQPTFDFFLYLAPDNAFLNQRFPGLAPDGAFVSRDNLDFGIRGTRSQRETLRGVIGFDGNITDSLRYEISYVHGGSRAETVSSNDRLADRFFAALDAVVDPRTGQITCRINLPGEAVIDPNNFGETPVTFQPGECQPLNILGTANQAALDFALVDHTDFAQITQQVVSGYVAGDFGFAFELPGGPVGFALGAEYRKEKSRTVPSEVMQQGLLLDASEVEVERGEYDVKEVFGELNVPILKDVPFAENLSFGVAVRLSDYSTVGSTATYKFDAVYAPVRDVSFRGTYSQSVRAPNINELFAPLSGTFAFITDPCDIENRDEGTSTRAANCQAVLAGLGLTPDEIANFSPSSDPEQSTSRLGLTGGNPGLQEETAKTWTAGVVLRPRFVPGLSLALDGYDIKIRDTINTFTATQAFELCVDQPTLENVFCPLTSRDPATGFANGFTVTPQNVARFLVRGADLTVNYRFSPAPDLGTFNLRLVGGHLDRLTFINSPGAEPDENAGELDPLSAPKWIGTADLTWTRDALTVNYGLAWQDKVRRFTREQTRADRDVAEPRFLRYKERWEHDIQVGYDVDDKFNIYAGINNFTDQKPSVSSGGAYPISPIGRFFYFGVRADLGALTGL
jgi:iron complex outermembrane recepter protein